MNALVLQFARWLEAQPWSVGLHESFYMYNWIESIHVLTLMFSLGLLCLIDLRMLGLCFTQIPASRIAERLNVPMLIGFGIMIVTGVVLYTAIPVRTTQSVWFRLKLVLLVAALINAILFHRHMRASIASWDTASIPPTRTRVAAGLSLALWGGVVIAGRFIAYDWFDCGEANPAWIDAAIGCTNPVAAL